jgi:uncharacterized membrane protein YphA (DoxX/SURF4 family)
MEGWENYKGTIHLLKLIMKKIIFQTQTGYAPLPIRLLLAIVLFPHGAQKLLGWFNGHGFEGTMKFFTDTVGLPWAIGFLVILIEFFGPIAILVGFATRLWSIAILIVMTGIIFTSFPDHFFMNWFGTQETEGFEAQVDYRFELGDVFAGAPGRVTFRHLVGYQPVNTTVNIPGSFPTWAVQPKLRQSTFVSYENDAWSLSLQNQWLGRVRMATSDNALNGNSQNYVDSSLDHFNVIDTTISKKFEVNDGALEAFLTVNNLLNERAPLFPSASGLPGLFYPTLGIHDDMGRFYTAGFKLKF